MKETLTIVLSGEAGQGLQTIEEFLVQSIKSDYHVFSNKEVMSRVRGGNNTVEIVISDKQVYAYRNDIDVLFLLNNDSFDRLKKRVHEKTVIIGESSFLSEDNKKKYEMIELNLTELSKTAGNKLYANTILFGYIARMISLETSICEQIIRSNFKKLKEEIIEANIQAFSLGYNHYKKTAMIKEIAKNSMADDYKMIDGTTALSIGALAGGCNFVASYPMSPSTGVLIYLSKKAKEFNVLVEQAEDEIAALNMVIGAWYTGARGLATTSGGGFALMGEALSLSGITETPCVIHIAQRPGPATGLPTRTEQGDLNLALYAGHGEFPRIILAPGKLEDACLLGQKAFYLADKYQVPVIILTDQYFLESMGEMKKMFFEEKYLKQFIEKTDSGYLRYKLSDHPVSIRGVPGFGDGFVKVDSDEHGENGLLTEDFDIRVQMNDKRLAKEKLILDDYQEANLIGSSEYDNLIIGWGSTYGVLEEYVRESKDSTSFLYIKQVYPLSSKLLPYLRKAKKIICVENNATGQFANLLHWYLDVKADIRILKYNGEPFSIEEINLRLKEATK
ncbi:MAG: 2-oxoacid:acceptor oxidoreductase subunit alpha [Clostridia bacterium]|nr:2-oxoacid:acceptor oxidoreductase subunit alpha [Clostridia bacterium]